MLFVQMLYYNLTSWQTLIEFLDSTRERDRLPEPTESNGLNLFNLP